MDNANNQISAIAALKISEWNKWQEEFLEGIERKIMKNPNALDAEMRNYINKARVLVYEDFRSPPTASIMSEYVGYAIRFFADLEQSIFKRRVDLKDYYHSMSELLAMYCDLKVNTLLVHKERFDDVRQHFLHMIRQFLANNCDYITNALLRIQRLRVSRQLFENMFKFVEQNANFEKTQTNCVSYCRYILFYRQWKKMYTDMVTLREITARGAERLKAPPNFRKHKLFEMLRPKNAVIPPNLTLFFLTSPIRTNVAVDNFFSVDKYEPENPSLDDLFEVVDLTDEVQPPKQEQECSSTTSKQLNSRLSSSFGSPCTINNHRSDSCDDTYNLTLSFNNMMNNVDQQSTSSSLNKQQAPSLSSISPPVTPLSSYLHRKDTSNENNNEQQGNRHRPSWSPTTRNIINNKTKDQLGSVDTGIFSDRSSANSPAYEMEVKDVVVVPTSSPPLLPPPPPPPLPPPLPSTTTTTLITSSSDVVVTTSRVLPLFDGGECDKCGHKPTSPSIVNVMPSTPSHTAAIPQTTISSSSNTASSVIVIVDDDDDNIINNQGVVEQQQFQQQHEEIVVPCERNIELQNSTILQVVTKLEDESCSPLSGGGSTILHERIEGNVESTISPIEVDNNLLSTTVSPAPTLMFTPTLTLTSPPPPPPLPPSPPLPSSELNLTTTVNSDVSDSCVQTQQPSVEQQSQPFINTDIVVKKTNLKDVGVSTHDDDIELEQEEPKQANLVLNKSDFIQNIDVAKVRVMSVVNLTPTTCEPDVGYQQMSTLSVDTGGVQESSSSVHFAEDTLQIDKSTLETSSTALLIQKHLPPPSEKSNLDNEVDDDPIINNDIDSDTEMDTQTLVDQMFCSKPIERKKQNHQKHKKKVEKLESNDFINDDDENHCELTSYLRSPPQNDNFFYGFNNSNKSGNGGSSSIFKTSSKNHQTSLRHTNNNHHSQCSIHLQNITRKTEELLSSSSSSTTRDKKKIVKSNKNILNISTMNNKTMDTNNSTTTTTNQTTTKSILKNSRKTNASNYPNTNTAVQGRHHQQQQQQTKPKKSVVLSNDSLTRYILDDNDENDGLGRQHHHHHHHHRRDKSSTQENGSTSSSSLMQMIGQSRKHGSIIIAANHYDKPEEPNRRNIIEDKCQEFRDHRYQFQGSRRNLCQHSESRDRDPYGQYLHDSLKESYYQPREREHTPRFQRQRRRSVTEIPPPFSYEEELNPKRTRPNSSYYEKIPPIRLTRSKSSERKYNVEFNISYTQTPPAPPPPPPRRTRSRSATRKQQVNRMSVEEERQALFEMLRRKYCILKEVQIILNEKNCLTIEAYREKLAKRNFKNISRRVVNQRRNQRWKTVDVDADDEKETDDVSSHEVDESTSESDNRANRRYSRRNSNINETTISGRRRGRSRTRKKQTFEDYETRETDEKSIEISANVQNDALTISTPPATPTQSMYPSTTYFSTPVRIPEFVESFQAATTVVPVPLPSPKPDEIRVPSIQSSIERLQNSLASPITILPTDNPEIVNDPHLLTKKFHSIKSGNLIKTASNVPRRKLMNIFSDEQDDEIHINSTQSMSDNEESLSSIQNIDDFHVEGGATTQQMRTKGARKLLKDDENRPMRQCRRSSSTSNRIFSTDTSSTRRLRKSEYLKTFRHVTGDLEDDNHQSSLDEQRTTTIDNNKLTGEKLSWEHYIKLSPEKQQVSIVDDEEENNQIIYDELSTIAKTNEVITTTSDDNQTLSNVQTDHVPPPTDNVMILNGLSSNDNQKEQNYLRDNTYSYPAKPMLSIAALDPQLQPISKSKQLDYNRDNTTPYSYPTKLMMSIAELEQLQSIHPIEVVVPPPPQPLNTVVAIRSSSFNTHLELNSLSHDDVSHKVPPCDNVSHKIDVPPVLIPPTQSVPIPVQQITTLSHNNDDDILSPILINKSSKNNNEQLLSPIINTTTKTVKKRKVTFIDNVTKKSLRNHRKQRKSIDNNQTINDLSPLSEIISDDNDKIIKNTFDDNSIIINDDEKNHHIDLSLTEVRNNDNTDNKKLKVIKNTNELLSPSQTINDNTHTTEKTNKNSDKVGDNTDKKRKIIMKISNDLSTSSTIVETTIGDKKRKVIKKDDSSSASSNSDNNTSDKVGKLRFFDLFSDIDDQQPKTKSFIPNVRKRRLLSCSTIIETCNKTLSSSTVVEATATTTTTIAATASTTNNDNEDDEDDDISLAELKKRNVVALKKESGKSTKRNVLTKRGSNRLNKNCDMFNNISGGGCNSTGTTRNTGGSVVSTTLDEIETCDISVVSCEEVVGEGTILLNNAGTTTLSKTTATAQSSKNNGTKNTSINNDNNNAVVAASSTPPDAPNAPDIQTKKSLLNTIHKSNSNK